MINRHEFLKIEVSLTKRATSPFSSMFAEDGNSKVKRSKERVGTLTNDEPNDWTLSKIVRKRN